ncbi:MAG TPA: ergothioneine biosynthesis protein EgtC [Coleofasciculaceae cyanobacterium]|jgi:glutamine amidotransferase
MCRLLGYLGAAIQLDHLLYKPEHSLIVQSYQPREMTSGVVNADGLGIGWYHTQRDVQPFTYKSTLPIWNETNLPELSRYIESKCVLGYVRSATPGQALDMSNCQPFRDNNLLLIHNGYIDKFRKTLYRPIRDRLSDQVYQSINGTTDSEHIFALLSNELQASPDSSIEKALHATLLALTQLAQSHHVSFSATLIISDGHHLVASRYALGTSTPTLYWLRDDPTYPDAVIIASEPLFTGNWNSCPNSSILSVGEDLEVHIHQI